MSIEIDNLLLYSLFENVKRNRKWLRMLYLIKVKEKYKGESFAIGEDDDSISRKKTFCRGIASFL